MRRKWSFSHPGVGEALSWLHVPSSSCPPFLCSSSQLIVLKSLSTLNAYQSSPRLQPTLPSFGCHRSPEPALTASMGTNSMGPLLSSSGSLPFYSVNYSFIPAALHSFGLLHTTSSWGSAPHFGLPFSVSVSQVLWDYNLSLDDAVPVMSNTVFVPATPMSVSSPALSRELPNQVKMTHIPGCLIDLSPLTRSKGFSIPFFTLPPSIIDLPDIPPRGNITIL